MGLNILHTSAYKFYTLSEQRPNIPTISGRHSLDIMKGGWYTTHQDQVDKLFKKQLFSSVLSQLPFNPFSRLIPLLKASVFLIR
jgi:hypothetical protein